MRRSIGLGFSTFVLATGAALGGHDFNGDGFDDLAVGSPLEDFGGFDDVGAVTVIYGAVTGLGNGPPALFITMAELELAPEQVNMNFGNALAAGDFDGDGFDDLAIAATYLAQAGLKGAGAVVVLRGSANGLQKVGMQLLSQAAPGVPDKPEPSIFFPDASDERFGESMVAADFDGDGRDDLVVSVRESVTKFNESSGAIHVFKGSKKGLRLKGSKLHLNSKGIPGQAAFMAGFGQRLATGDFNGDGRADLLLTTGVPYDIDTSMTTFVLRGSKKGLVTKGLLALPPDGNGQTLNDTSGSPLALAAGDTDGDGIDDAVLGAWFETVDDLTGAGAIHCFDGSAGGLDPESHDQIDRGGPAVLSEPEQSSYFGYTLALGDFDGDGDADTVVAAPQASVSANDGAGDVAVFPGSVLGPSTTGDSYWSQEGLSIPEDAEPGDGFGSSLATGDFDGDGADDLAIGSPRESDGAVVRAGAVHVIYGLLASGLDTNSCVLFAQSDAAVPDLAETNDEFATVLCR